MHGTSRSFEEDSGTDNVTFENANIANPTGGSPSAVGAIGNIDALEDLEANQRLPSAQRASTNFLRPYRGYSQILMRLAGQVSVRQGF